MPGLNRFLPAGLGWKPDLPDPRDFRVTHPTVRTLLNALKHSAGPCGSVDLRFEDEVSLFSDVDDQGTLNSSTEFACLALVEYFERRALGRTFEGAPRFLYEMTRSPEQHNSSLGIRSTIKALLRYGTPPAMLYPYTDQPVSPPTDLRLLGFTSTVSNAVYFRLDPPDQAPSVTLHLLKSFLAAGFPVIFGFAVPFSVSHKADVEFRPMFDSYRGGQTVLAVGFDDSRMGRDGSLLFRNSWGGHWGDNGYGWLPYTFLESHCARDFWAFVRPEWLDTSEFDRPSLDTL